MTPPMAQLDSEFAALLDLCEELQPHSLLEIGVWQGGTLARFRERFPEIAAVGIDPCPSGAEADNTIAGVPLVVGRSQDRQVRHQAIEILLHQTGRELPGGVPDIVHIDGSHTLLDTWADLLWAIRLQPKLIALHDVTARVHPQLEGWLAWDSLKAAPPLGWNLWEVRHSLTEYGYGCLLRAP